MWERITVHVDKNELSILCGFGDAGLKKHSEGPMQLAAVVLFTVKTHDENRIEYIVIEVIEERERLLCKKSLTKCQKLD